MTGGVCPDRWHDMGWRSFAAPYVIEETQYSGISATSYRCRTCRMRTMSLTDDDGGDITDAFVTRSWQPSLWTRIVDCTRDNARNRHLSRIAKSPCRDCGEVKPPAGYGETDYSCADCLVRILG